MSTPSPIWTQGDEAQNAGRCPSGRATGPSDLSPASGSSQSSVPNAFTPGPWRPNVARLSDGSINVAHVITADGISVAQMANHGADVTEANATLIAAAPELFEALAKARVCVAAFYEGLTPNHVSPLPSLESIDAALAKALGEPK